jgi:hypothetical protein
MMSRQVGQNGHGDTGPLGAIGSDPDDTASQTSANDFAFNKRALSSAYEYAYDTTSHTDGELLHQDVEPSNHLLSLKRLHVHAHPYLTPIADVTAATIGLTIILMQHGVDFSTAIAVSALLSLLLGYPFAKEAEKSYIKPDLAKKILPEDSENPLTVRDPRYDRQAQYLIGQNIFIGATAGITGYLLKGPKVGAMLGLYNFALNFIRTSRGAFKNYVKANFDDSHGPKPLLADYWFHRWPSILMQFGSEHINLGQFVFATWTLAEMYIHTAILPDLLEGDAANFFFGGKVFTGTQIKLPLYNPATWKTIAIAIAAGLGQAWASGPFDSRKVMKKELVNMRAELSLYLKDRAEKSPTRINRIFASLFTVTDSTQPVPTSVPTDEQFKENLKIITVDDLRDPRLPASAKIKQAGSAKPSNADTCGTSLRKIPGTLISEVLQAHALHRIPTFFFGLTLTNIGMIASKTFSGAAMGATAVYSGAFDLCSQTIANSNNTATATEVNDYMENNFGVSVLVLAGICAFIYAIVNFNQGIAKSTAARDELKDAPTPWKCLKRRPNTLTDSETPSQAESFPASSDDAGNGYGSFEEGKQLPNPKLSILTPRNRPTDHDDAPIENGPAPDATGAPLSRPRIGSASSLP